MLAHHYAAALEYAERRASRRWRSQARRAPRFATPAIARFALNSYAQAVAFYEKALELWRTTLRRRSCS